MGVLSRTIRPDREHTKFTETVNDEIAVRVVVADGAGQTPIGLFKGSVAFNEVTAVSSNTETTIISLVVSPAMESYITSVFATGSSDGVYRLKIDGVTSAIRRTAWTERNAEFKFNSLRLIAGQTLTVTVIHNELPDQDFSTDIEYVGVSV